MYGQEFCSNDYFIFEVIEKDLKSLCYVYWAHLALWKNRYANNTINKHYKIESFEELICNELNALKLEDDPPDFGYNEPDLNVLAISWDYPKFKILKKTALGLHIIDEDLYEYYLDLNESDICSAEDLEFEDELLIEGSFFTCNLGDPVFMCENTFAIVKKRFLEKIKVLNKIYSKVNFPHQIIIKIE